MTNRKPQNSILVLATLGVYLGLVLVGATPQVWAQAAMSQQFDIKDEIEVTDNLDKKPSDSSIATIDESVTASDSLVERSVEKFLASFESTSFIGCTLEFRGFETAALTPTHPIERSQKRSSFELHKRFLNTVAVNNLARAGLDSLLADSAK